MSKSVVIGIDPGSHIAGIAVVKGDELKSVRQVKSLTGEEYDDNDLAAYMTSFMLEIQDDIEIYEPDLLVCELCSVPTNMHTNKLLAYWEAAAMIAASMNNISVKRLRTSEARKKALGKNYSKEETIKIIRERYETSDYRLTSDEAESIVFALAGVSFLNEYNDPHWSFA